MKHPLFSIRELLKESWSIFTRHWKFIISAGLVTMAVNMVLQTIQNSVPMSHNFVIGALATILVILVGIMIKLGWSRILLDLIRNSTANWNDFKTKPTVWLQFIKVTLWFMLCTIGMMIVAAIPGAIIAAIGFGMNIDAILVVGVVLGSAGLVLTAAYMGIRYQFINFVVLDFPELSAKAMFKKAGAITKGHFWQLVWLGVLLGLVNVLGLLLLVVGLIATIPVTKLAQTKAYELCKSRLN